jgi:hypothetical protein
MNNLVFEQQKETGKSVSVRLYGTELFIPLKHVDAAVLRIAGEEYRQ